MKKRVLNLAAELTEVLNRSKLYCKPMNVEVNGGEYQYIIEFYFKEYKNVWYNRVSRAKRVVIG